jgi:tRNA-uridine 2-sulfurtransferase
MRCIVGLSGGVDSTLAAALLCERGVEVIGVYLKIVIDATVCPWRDEIFRCRRVAAKLDIPLYIVDASDRYRRDVLNPMLEGYAEGKTPNPDIGCNRFVKFVELGNAADRFGATQIATGHYARTVARFDGSTSLLRGRDSKKDQSYFLWKMTQKQLARVDFPLGDWQKHDVRVEAKKRGFENWDARSSRGICFLGTSGIAALTSHRIDQLPADVITTSGEHIGAVHSMETLTTGQRLRLASRQYPHYVVKRDFAARKVIVSDTPSDPAQWASNVTIEHARWFSDSVKFPLACSARVRHGQEPQSCRVELRKDGAVVVFDHPQRAIANGQSIVFNQGDTVLGGAVMREAIKTPPLVEAAERYAATER